MQISLNEYWNKSPFLSKPKADQGWRLKALPIRVPGTPDACTLWIEPRLIVILLLVPVIYVFAGETGNQWFYLLAASIISALIMGVLIPLLTVLEVDAHASLPSSAVAGERVPVKVSLNRKTKFGPFVAAIPLRWLIIKVSVKSNDVRISQIEPIVVEAVDEEMQLFTETPPAKRGVCKLSGVEIYSCYPFGIVWWSRRITPQSDDPFSTQTLTIYPPLVLMEGHFLYRIRAAQEAPTGMSSRRVQTRGQSMSVKGVREFRHGDSPRMVHWPSSARLGKLLVREYESEGMPGFDLLLNLRNNWRSEEQFELAVALAHSICHLGYKVGLLPEFIVIPNLDDDSPTLPSFMSDMPTVHAGLSRMSEILARVEIIHDEATADERLADLGEHSSQALITIRPAEPSINHVVDDPDLAVELAVIPRTHSAAGGTVIQDVHMPMHEGGIANRRQGGKSSGRVLAVLQTFEEFVKL
ncbi:MAG TPA: DUF58 domain-containing protein [Oculatellaceae cyanobacterium]